jgi:hypothetical protein
VGVVDDHRAGVVEDEVGRRGRPRYDEGGRLAWVEGDPHPAGEVVAGAQRDQPELGRAQRPGAVQGVHGGVQAAVPSGDDDRAVLDALAERVEVVGGDGLDDLHLAGPAQDLQSLLQGLLRMGPRLRVGNQQDPLHRPDSTWPVRPLW